MASPTGIASRAQTAHNRRVRALLAAAISVSILGAATAATSALSPRAALLSVIHAQDAAYNARDWKRLWSYYSPRYRSICDYAEWVAGSKAHLDPPLHTKVTNVRFNGPKADVAYEVYERGRLTMRVFLGDPDRFVLVRGRWYDDIDDQTNCDSF
jgi:hypothetical protein